MDQKMSNQNNESGRDPTATPSQQVPAGEDAAAGEATELEALRAECATMKDKLLRALAEMENQRRRTEREIADAKSDGAASLAREALALADKLRRALASFPEAAREGAEAHVAALIEGVELTERDFHSRLARFGIKEIDALGTRFDPNLHEALYEIPDETQAAGTVAQVIEPGYMIGDRVLRPVKVGVTRGGPKAAS
jgi:molecular chaperone GrpE